MKTLQAQAKSKREKDLVALAFQNGFDACERAAQHYRQALQTLGLVTSDQIEDLYGEPRAMNEADKDREEAITLAQAHRYLIPSPEVASMLAFADDVISAGEVEVYRNLKTGGLLLAYVCEHCELHHPIIDIEYLEEETEIGGSDRFLLPVLGSIPYMAYLQASQGMGHLVSEPYHYSVQLIAQRSDKRSFEPETTPGDVFMCIQTALESMMDGSCSLSLDTDSGRTVLSYNCGECDAHHALFSIATPEMVDARVAKEYAFLGNPFLDLLLEESGERRH